MRHADRAAFTLNVKNSSSSPHPADFGALRARTDVRTSCASSCALRARVFGARWFRWFWSGRVACACCLALATLALCVLVHAGVLASGPSVRTDLIAVGPHARASTTFEGVRLPEPDTFWATFRELNTDLLRSRRPVLVYRANYEGLGNNLSPMLSAALLSVVLRRGFRFEWRGGGAVANIAEFVDWPFDTYDALRDEAVAAGGELARQFARHDVTVHPACVINIGTTASEQCVRGLVCADLAASAIVRDCAHLAITGNADVTNALDSNGHLAADLRFLFGSPVGLINARLAPRVLRPSALARESVARKLAAISGFSPATTLGVHLRTNRVPLATSVECVLKLHQSLGTRLVFLATDSSEARESLRAALGSQLVTFDSLDGDVEEDGFRKATVFTAWEGALVVAACHQKALSLQWPASSFSHIIYFSSQTDHQVFDLASCAAHPPWRHVQQVYKRNDWCTDADADLSSCKGKF